MPGGIEAQSSDRDTDVLREELLGHPWNRSGDRGRYPAVRASTGEYLLSMPIRAGCSPGWALSRAWNTYEALRRYVRDCTLEGGTAQFNEYHALIVRHAARICRVRPACGDCCLAGLCEKNGVAA